MECEADRKYHGRIVAGKSQKEMARKNPFEAEIAASLRNQFRWQHSRLPDAIMGRGVQRPFDFLLLLPYRAVGIEAKQTKNRTSFSLSSLSPHQHENLALVSALNHEAYVAINFRDHHSPRLNEAYLIPYYDLILCLIMNISSIFLYLFLRYSQ